MKKKYKKIVYKRRIALTQKEYEDYINKNKMPLHDEQIMKEIDYEIKTFNLKPKIFIAYNRLSYYSKESKDLRITFDTNLRSRRTNLSLNERKENQKYFDENTYIMEIKTTRSIPFWLSQTLSQNKIYPCSFSKIGNIYKKERRKIIC